MGTWWARGRGRVDRLRAGRGDGPGAGPGAWLTDGRGGVLLGLTLCGLLHLLQVPMNHLVRPALAYAGLTQWLYLAPAAWAAGRSGYPMVRRGLIVGGGVTLVINGIAYGIMYYLFFIPKG